MNDGFLILLGVWVMLGVAFVIIDQEAMKRLRPHRIDLRPGASIHAGWRILTWQMHAYDPASYDEEGKRILRVFRARIAALFATWVAAALLATFWFG